MKSRIFFSKVILVTGMILLTTVAATAQARIGSRSSDIMSEFSHKGIQMARADNGTYYLWYKDQSVTVAYYLDDNSYCTSTAIIPHNQGVLNWYCEKFNKEAVIISDTRWKLYTANGVLYIELVYADDGGYYFYLH